MNRRHFIGVAGSTTLLLLTGANVFAGVRKEKANGEFLFLEAEQFADLGDGTLISSQWIKWVLLIC